MRKENRLRGALLSVLSFSLVAVATAGGVLIAQAPEEVDLFELRLELIDRIEAAYISNDASTLRRMAATERVYAELSKRHPRSVAEDGLNSVTSASIPGLLYGAGILWDWAQAEMCDSAVGAISSCDDDYNRCIEDVFYSGLGNPNNADPQAMKIAEQQCEIGRLMCELDENRASSACQWLLPFAPPPEQSAPPELPTTPER